MRRTQPAAGDSFSRIVYKSVFNGMIYICIGMFGTVSFADEKSTIEEKHGKQNFNELILFDFDSDNDVSAWRIVNDTVMGGVSSSAMKRSAKGWAVFTGNVSLENNGGFASARSPRLQQSLDAYEGIAIRVRADGKRYKVGLRTDDAFDGIIHQAPFDTKIGEYQLIKIPFSNFVPTYHGRRLSEDNRMSPKTIRSVSFLISDRQKGYFRIEIDWIKAYR